eukprot:GHUV01008648.1.p1 GENE.GHUV01008648.1~~GHUV01008648.1.p1  ORF type:complete len:2405 (+),score=620.50 GHUV01008648.1:939-7217(+)
MAGSLAAVGCQEGFEPYLPAIAAQLRESLAVRTKGKPGSNVTEALQCVGVLASALHVSWQPFAQQLLDCMMHTGPSQNLVQALSDIATALPDLLEDIQGQMLDMLSLILQSPPKTFNPQTKGKQFQALIHSLSMSELSQAEQIKLALNTIGTMDFGRVVLLDFMRESILPYIDDADKEIRQAAALACCRILERHASTNAAATHGASAAAAAAAAGLGLAPMDARSSSIAAAGLAYPVQQQQINPGLLSPVVQVGALIGLSAVAGTGFGSTLKQIKAIEAVVGKLLMAAVADTSERVRRTVLEALTSSPALDKYLAQADCLRALFVALNDESRDVRATALKLVGRLEKLNAAYVAPALRRHLLQLLTDMDHSPDSRQRDDSAYLLNCLINSAPELILPYISPIQKALVTKLKGSSCTTTPSSTAAGTAGAMVPATTAALVTSSGLVTHQSPSGSSNNLGKDGKGAASAEAGVIKSVLATLGALAQQAGTKFSAYVNEVMPLVIEAIQDVGSPSKRRAAVITLGQICQSAGSVMTPYWEHPQLLALLLRLLHEGNISKGRCEVMRVLGIIGALDPYTHKVNTASLSGEGKLELEGVRPLRTNAAAAANIAASIMAGTPMGGLTGGPPGPPGAADDFANDLLPAAGLVTSSEDYYPTVAINALMRVLRDSGLSSQHQAVISSLMQIFKALGTASVPYLPKVLPVLFAVLRVCDEPLRELLLEQLVVLIVVVRQHIRRFLPDLLGIMGEFWGRSSKIQHVCLQMLAELAISLRDDLRPYIPELLPRLVALFVDAERNSTFDMVRPALIALEALGVALEEQLHLLLPALMRLVAASGGSTPLEIRRAVLKSMKRLLPRMHLAGFSSAVLQPLMKVLDGPSDELRRDALDTICALAVALGQDFNIFVPTIDKIVTRHRVQHEWFSRLAQKLNAEPPCCSDAEDWEDAGGWAAELDQLAEAAPVHPPVMPLDPGAAAPVKLAGRIGMLRKAWESSARVTKDDWSEWMRHFSVELLAQSPSPALRACHSLAQVHPTMARELFAAGFVSCWAELDPASQERLVRSLEAALASPTIPPEIVTALLNLAEFMEHDDKRLPLDTRTLGALAEKCHAFAKALHYKEMEFQTSPQTAIEALIHINNQLRQPEAAVGVLTYAQKHLAMELKESWYEKLCRWDEALSAYEGKLAVTQPNSQEYLTALLGKMRCLASLAEWEKLSNLCRVEWRKSEPHMRKEMSLIAAHAAWHMNSWEEMAIYVDTVDSGPGGSSSGSMTMSASFQALQALQHNSSVGGSAAAAMAAATGTAVGRAQGLGVLQGLRSPTNGRGAVTNGMDMRQSQASAAADAVAAGVLAGGPTSSTGAFLRAVLCIKHDQHELARYNIERARDLMSTELAALVGESYERAYTDMVRVQQLTELEEVIGYKEALARSSLEPVVSDEKVRFIKGLWRKRLSGVQRNVEVWQSLFSVRSLVVPMHEDVDAWLKFASLCRKSARPRQAARMLVQLLGYDPQAITRPGQPGFGAGSGAPSVMLAYCKHMWATGQRNDALARLRELVEEVRSIPAEPPAPFVKPDLSNLTAIEPAGSLSHLAAKRFRERPRPSLHARCFLRLGLFQWHLQDGSLANEGQLNSCMELMRAATEYGANWPKAWHHWALFNCGVLEALHKRGEAAAAGQYVAPAVTGFFRSVALGQAAGDRTGNLQDILRLLTLWFTWGSAPDVEAALQEGFGLVSIDTWLVVIPQIIARIHTNNPQVRNLIHSLLVRIGRHHPQALMYPLLVAAKSQSPSRRQAAFNVIDVVRTHSATLVEQATLVSTELIRIAILWHEMWHEALEEASRLYFGESNVEAMLNVLLPLHELMEKTGPSTLKEIAFVQAYGRELSEAYEWLSKFRVSRKEAELHQAWDLYYHVFKRINKQLHSMTTLELQYVAPALVRAQGMELAVPGTYIAGEPLVTIAAFAPQLQVISSKQRPRKLTIHGGDGAEYMFLLKGHEDLRQDERVMQLFGLVNNMLGAERSTAERDLSIARYAVIPLSPNSGLIGWVPNCDTLHALIREYRDSRKIPLNWEHRLMLGMAPDYDHLHVIHKVEVFEYALDATSGEDLHKV